LYFGPSCAPGSRWLQGHGRDMLGDLVDDRLVFHAAPSPDSVQLAIAANEDTL
jgi:hypothetical protein